MAIDFLIFGLLLISFVINLLALGAFWVTPALRTTANRFTINLLVINLIGCLILAPTLFLSGATSSTTSADVPTIVLGAQASDDRIEILAKPGNHQMTIKHNGKMVEQEGVIVRRNMSSSAAGKSDDPRTIETIFKCNNTYCHELTIDEGSETIVITEIEEENHRGQSGSVRPGDTADALSSVSMRCWSIDMAAALGALAVLLVVGDTWCAVTDPLRYHSRISGVKTWIFIALTWAVGLLFGALSAFRELDFESTTLSEEHRLDGLYTEAKLSSLSTTNGIFNIIFACAYFVIIILLPFGFVCGMYWRIFSEARENGLRMRQNGSSPLLQSALNLTHHQQSSSMPYSSSICAHRNSVSSASSNGGSGAGNGGGGGGGLQMQIDQRRSSPSCPRRDSAAKILLPTISDDGLSDEANVEFDAEVPLVPLTQAANHINSLADRNQNILLTLQSASGEIKRNYSARQLPLLGTSSQDLHERSGLQGIRQVHSSPNLQKYTQERTDALTSPHLLGHEQLHNQSQASTQRHFQLNALHGHTNSHQHHGHHHPHALQLPAMQHTSPKSYMSTLRHRLSNASSLFKYREESRTVRISMLVVIMFLVSYLPYGLLVLLQSRVPEANFAHSTQLAIFMLLLGNLTSPFIFAYRNKRVRRGVKRLFGLDSRTRERTLQRQSSSSGRGSGFLNRQLTGSRHTGNIKRNISKISTYSLNSCKHLTPQSSLTSNGPPATAATQPVSSKCTPIPVHASKHTLGLRPNNSCCTIINFGAEPLNDSGDCSECKAAEKMAVVQQLQNGTARISEQLICNGSGKFAPKRNLFKMFFKSSKNLSCAAAQVCTQGKADVEPAEV